MINAKQAGRTAAIAGLAALLLPLGAHARRSCECGNLPQIEREIAEQEYLLKLFSQWADYVPGSLLSTADMRERADILFNLTFYGAPVQAPHGTGSGAGAAFGTQYLLPGCPLLAYVYDKKGNPVYRETAESKREHRDPPELEQKTRPITEAKYKSNQCSALVHYAFVHEEHHRDTCRANEAAGQQSKWQELSYFAREDKAAYAAGLEVLYQERTRLKAKCDKARTDGRWHGTLQYAYTYNDYGSQVVKKGDDSVYITGEGFKEWGDRKSVRARGTIDASSAGGNIKVPYSASRQASWFSKGKFTMQSDCGWYRHPVWKLDNGTETRLQGESSGTAEGLLQSFGQHLHVSFHVPPMNDATLTRHDWDKPQGYCNERLNKQTDESYGRTQTTDSISVSMDVEIDPDHPDDIDVIRIEPDSGGKGQYYYALKLHREPAP